MPIVFKRISLVALLLALMLGAGVTLVQSQQAGTITLGMITCQTGALSSAFGVRFPAVANGLVDFINNNGGLGPNGLKIKLEIRDDQTKGGPGRAAAEELINVLKVPAIIGSCSSGSTIPISSVTIPNKVVQISSSATSPAVTTLKDDDFVFRTDPSDALQGTLAASVAFNGPTDPNVPGRGYRKVAIIVRNDAYGIGLADAFASNFKALGGETVTLPYAEDATDFSAQIQAAAAAKPDVVAIYSFDEGEALVKQLVAAGVTKFELFTDGTQNDVLMNSLAKAIGDKLLVGKIGTAAANSTSTTGFAAFKEFYKQVFPADANPFVFTPATYDAVFVLALAIEKVLDDAKGDVSKVTGTAIRDQLRFVANPPGEVVTVGEWKKAKDLLAAGKDINYEGAQSNTDFDENGDTIGPEGLWQIWKLDDGTVTTPFVRACPFSGKNTASAVLDPTKCETLGNFKP